MSARSVSIDRAALLLDVSRRTIYNRIKEGQLATVRVGQSQRVLVESLEVFSHSIHHRGAVVSDVTAALAQTLRTGEPSEQSMRNIAKPVWMFDCDDEREGA